MVNEGESATRRATLATCSEPEPVSAFTVRHQHV